MLGVSTSTFEKGNREMKIILGYKWSPKLGARGILVIGEDKVVAKAKETVGDEG